MSGKSKMTDSSADIRILVVDDNQDLRDSMNDILDDWGYKVSGVSTKTEALEKVSQGFFHIALVDLKLPDGSGLEVVDGIRTSHPDTMVIIMTGHASLDTSIEAMNKGAYTYIQKPCDMDEVKLNIDGALEKQRLVIENKRLLEELKQSNTALEQSNAQLIKLNDLKSVFVGNVSHEVRSPMTIIKEGLDGLRDGIYGEINSDQKKTVSLVINTVDRLKRLVDDLLDLSKIEAGKMEMRRSKINVPEFIEEVCALCAAVLKNKQMTLEQDLDPNLDEIWGDRDKLQQATINILTNAIKFTPQGGRIKIKVRDEAKDGNMRFEIADTGPGISNEELGLIFNKFERVTKEKAEGTGLGLPITKDIIELHKGRIWVESELQKGTRFIFVLPKDLLSGPR